jgi:hypothetical protein
MKTIVLRVSFIALALTFFISSQKPAQDFQGTAYYFSKTKMDLGRWGARMSEAQKKQIEARMKSQLEKTFVLNFNKAESFFLRGGSSGCHVRCHQFLGKEFCGWG